MGKRKYFAVAPAAILVLGLYLTWFTWNRTVHALSEDVLEQARIVALSINPDRLRNLRGNESDLTSKDYHRIKEQLTRVRLSHRSCRFLYLMGRRDDGNVFFYVDSQPEDSKDYAPPGLVYEEVSNEYLYTFDTGKERTVGPIKDRWGTLITSLVPIYSRPNGDMLAVLGMDTTASDWNRKIISQCSVPITLTISLMIIALAFLRLTISNRLLKEQYIEKNKIAEELQQTLQHVKRLQGILPICASCKKIRDDKGYWSQIESYIRDHSEAQFSHGICPECKQKLYANLDTTNQ